MGKLLLGIIAVICLDLGFVAFMADDRTEETARMIVETVQETDLASDVMVAPASLSVYDEPAAMPVNDTPVTQRVVYVPVYVTRRAEPETVTRAVKKESRQDTFADPLPTTEAKVMAARFEERIAKKSAERKEAAQRDLIYELATMKDRKSEKRSFVASTVVPVVKKPWDFLKAVGDKIK